MKSKSELQETKADMSDIEHIRLRPSMYVGRLGDGSRNDDAIYAMFRGLLCCITDELRMGLRDRIDINIVDSHTVSMRDYGCGIPYNDMIMKVTDFRYFDEYLKGIPKRTEGIFCPVIINALSSFFKICCFRDGVSRIVEFERGSFVSDTTEETCIDDGTYISFTPDEALFGSYCFHAEYIESMLHDYSCLNSWLTITLNGERFCSDDGLKELLQSRSAADADSIIHFKGDDIEIAFTYTDKCGEECYSFVNGWETRDGGTHLEAFRESFVQVIYAFIPSKNIRRSDIFNGFAAAISIRIEEPVFQHQMRYKLGSITIAPGHGSMTIKNFVTCFMKKRLCTLLKQSSSARSMILERVIALAQERKRLRPLDE